MVFFLFRSMGVTAEMLRPFLEGWSVKQIIDAKRLFVCDFKILDNLPTIDDRPVSKRKKNLPEMWVYLHPVQLHVMCKCNITLAGVNDSWKL